jgi:hypothetical protein
MHLLPKCQVLYVHYCYIRMLLVEATVGDPYNSVQVQVVSKYKSRSSAEMPIVMCHVHRFTTQLATLLLKVSIMRNELEPSLLMAVVRVFSLRYGAKFPQVPVVQSSKPGVVVVWLVHAWQSRVCSCRPFCSRLIKPISFLSYVDGPVSSRHKVNTIKFLKTINRPRPYPAECRQFPYDLENV